MKFEPATLTIVERQKVRFKMQRPKGSERIVVALDSTDVSKVMQQVMLLASSVGAFKIGLEFITAMAVRSLTGDSIKNDDIQALANYMRGRVFWDGKWKDIPNTMGGAAKAVALLNPQFVNVHASAGIDAMFAVVDEVAGRSLVLAVTVLTSREENDAFLDYGAPTKAKVLQLARNAKLAGVDGIICSPQELPILKARRELKDMLYMTPGIRPAGADLNDQRRVMTPGECVLAGGDYMVIGRPITGAKDPVNAVFQITANIENAEAEMAAKGVK